MEENTLSWHDMVLQPSDIEQYAAVDKAGALVEIQRALEQQEQLSDYEREALDKIRRSR